MINEGLIHNLLTECKLKAITSGGKGGQNVNKVATRVELYFDIINSKFLDAKTKELLNTRLANKISGQGLIRIVASSGRTQYVNRKEVLDKFAALINTALKKQKVRKSTVKSKSADESRLRQKKLRGELKKLRSTME